MNILDPLGTAIRSFVCRGDNLYTILLAILLIFVYKNVFASRR